MTKTKFTKEPAKGQIMGLALNNMENGVETLTANQTTRCQLEHEGRLLLERVASEGMDERLLEYEGQLRHAATRQESAKEKDDRRMGWPTWAVALALIGGWMVGRTRLKM